MAIEHRNYSNPYVQALLQGIANSGSGGSNSNIPEEKQKAKAQKDAQQRAIEQAQTLSKTNPGANISVTPEGAAISHDFSMANQQKQMKDQAGAIQKLHDTYNKGSDKLSSQVQALGELSDAVGSNNQMSLGTARTLALKSMGMNRYNSEEAKAVLPGTLQSKMAGLFSGAGNDGQPLTDAQKKDLYDFRDSVATGVKRRHDELKNKSISGYADSPYADSGRIEAFKGSIGKDLDSSLENLGKTKYSAPAPAPEGQAGGFLGMLQKAPDGLKSLLFGSQPAQAAPADAPPAAQKAPEFDPDAYLKGK